MHSPSIFNETMGVHYSYRETFTLWAVTTKETKGEGLTIMRVKCWPWLWPVMAGKDKLIYNTLWGEVDM